MGFISVINYFELLILFTMLFRFLTQIADTYLGFKSLLGSMGLVKVKVFRKSCISVLLFFSCYSNVSIVFFKELCRITSKLKSIITLKYLLTFKRSNLLIYCFQRKRNPLAFFILRALVILYCNITWTSIIIHLHGFPTKELPVT